MTKNELDLDEELNENLDFLEEDDAHANQKGHAALSYKVPLSFNNLPKQLLIIVGALIVGVIIFGVIINSKKKHHAIAVIPKQGSTIASNLPTVNSKINQDHNQHELHPEHTPTEPQIHGSPQAHSSQGTLEALPHHPNTQIANQNPAAPVQAPTQTPTPSSVAPPQIPLPNQTTNNNLSWQELKKSIGDQNTHPVNPSNSQAIIPNNNNAQNQHHAANLEINPPVGGFERLSTPNQTNQLQANNNYNIQELKTIIADITQELTANVNQIKELQNSLRDISRSISNVNSSVNGVDSKVLNLTSTVDNLSMDVKNVKKYIQEEDLDLTANLKPSEPDLFSNTPEYVVHAVIPGRAWLKSSSGQIITITEGDSLGDYGKIALIDAANNIVRTSSGVVFR